DPLVPFNQARTLMKAGNYADAIPLLQESLQIRETCGALLNLGDCYEKLGRLASATSYFDRAHAIFEEAKDEKRMGEAAARATALRPMLSTITIKIEPDVVATTTLDAERASANVSQRVDGGEHIVRVTADCYEPFQVRVTVNPRGDSNTVRAAL